MSPLADAIYDILRTRTGQPDPRLSYAELAARLRDHSDAFEAVNHRSRQLYSALGEVADECRRLQLPSLAALVVRADTRRPGDAYYESTSPTLLYRGEQVNEWRQELDAVKRSAYPPRQDATGSPGADSRTEPP